MKAIMIVLMLMLALLQYRLWLGHDGVPAVLKLHHMVKVQKQNNAVLEERNKVLTVEVIDLKSGIGALEERARSELGMIKQGETFFHIISDKKGE